MYEYSRVRIGSSSHCLLCLLHFGEFAAGCVLEPLLNEKAPARQSRVERGFKLLEVQDDLFAD